MTTIFMNSMISLIKDSAKGIIGLGLLWMAGIFLERLLEKKVVLHYERHRGIVQGVARTLKYFCVFLGFIVLLKDMGIDLQGVITGIGLTTFSLGFALKDTISNIVAGVLILMYHPFHLGDYIIVSTDKVIAEGKVQSIDSRYTTLLTDKGIMLVPNFVLYANSITIKNK